MSLFTQKKLLLLSLAIPLLLNAREGETPGEEARQEKIGNFAVVGSMQPPPFLGFGQTVIDQYDLLFEAYPTWITGKNIRFSEMFIAATYGIRNDLSLLVAFPTALSLNAVGNHSSGSEDMFVQLEYAFYASHLKKSTNQFTIVTRFYLPTGSECKVPVTGSGAPSVFIGVTAERLSAEWYCYTSYGALFTTKYDTGSRFGNQFLYQAGFGKNIAYSSNRWILTWLVEFYGLYTQKSQVACVTDPNSGSNQIILAPSIWFSTNRVYLQGGVGPILDHSSGVQDTKITFFGAFGMGIRF